MVNERYTVVEKGEFFMKLFNRYRDQMLRAADIEDRNAIADFGNAACEDREISFLELLDLIAMEAELLKRCPDRVFD